MVFVSLFFYKGDIMAKISLICEQCGGHIVLDSSHEVGTCENCFSRFIIKQDQIVQRITQNITKHVYGYQGKDVEELLKDGFDLIDIGEDIQANRKFKRAIEIDPKCWNAWLGYSKTIPADYRNLISKVDAYRSTYALAKNEIEQMETFASIIGYIPDSLLRAAFVRAFNIATDNERIKMFDLVAGVVGCDESEIADLAIDLCVNDWRPYFVKAKFRQIRAKWAKVTGFFNPHLPEVATEVLDLFVKSYNIAKKENDNDAMQTIRDYLVDLGMNNAYKAFSSEVLKKIG